MKPNPNNKPTTQPNESPSRSHQETGSKESNADIFQAPKVELPKGGGAIQGIGEKFQANPVTGTGSMTVPIAMSPGRGGFTPQLALSYDSGFGNSSFGLGWNVGLPSISRKTTKGLPKYDGLPKYYDNIESDVFILSGAEDLVLLVNDDDSIYERIDGDYKVHRYIPRIEGLFARIEKWTHTIDKSSYWKSISKENITTIYGKSLAAKIHHPTDAVKVFQWKIERSYDEKGNILLYEYKKENGAGLEVKQIFEKNRNDTSSYTQTYLKRVKYGNTIPHLPVSSVFDINDWESNNKWLFELIFDYGEHNDQSDIPSYEKVNNWSLRKDPFSSFRSGFEIRTYRLCNRILMYHHFEQELGLPNYLVKSTTLEHDTSPILTKVKFITHTGYQYHVDRQAYSMKSFPPVTFDYTEQKIDPKIYEIQSSEIPNVPQGIDGSQYQFTDLYGEGLNGILSQKANAWYYKRNEGNGIFGAQQIVAEMPSLAVNAKVQITDLGGDGSVDALVQSNNINGYFELSDEGKWSHLKEFAHPVNFDLNDPSLRMLDLDGNGVPDILITENDCFVWYPADALEGYKSSYRVAKQLEEEQGPRVVFSEVEQTIFLADMSGDGLTDIVRLTNGSISYWANMGYGRFSAKVTMQAAPHFDNPDQYNPSSIRFADIDGSGSTDILYLGSDKISYWLNHSGNGWSEEIEIENYPKTSNLHTVSVLDLLGNGTSCIVWSSPLPSESQIPMKYIQLMGNTDTEGNKPYLLKEVNNNMGVITRMKYEASTKFYLEDKRKGEPWITKLHFPVQVLARQEIYDEIAGNHFVSRYAYHHGYFDKVEREFRGFGMVEQWDTEDYETLRQNTLFEAPGHNWSEEVDIMPPVYTKTWFHNGYYKQTGKISKQYASEYYNLDLDAYILPDTELPTKLNPEEKREAARALKGRALRVEVYGLDDSPESIHPYTVAETRYHIKTIQNKTDNRHACFYVCACESLNFQYERNPDDPRIAHQSTLEIDDYGNVLKAAAVVYPRRSKSIYSEQNIGYVTLTEADYINQSDLIELYRIGIPFAQRTYEITGLSIDKPFEKEALSLALLAASEIAFEESSATGIQKRLVQSTLTSFLADDLQSELPFGQIGKVALPYQQYEAVYTDGLLAKFEKDGIQLLDSQTIESEGRFIKIANHWWRQSGKVIYDSQHYYLPITQLDPMGQEYHLAYDQYHLAMLSTSTEIYNKTILSQAQIDYRTLQPTLLTDPNGNQQEVIFDEVGLVMVTAIKGKNGAGDSLDNYEVQPSLAMDQRDYIYANRNQYLQGATSFFYYDLESWTRDRKPNHTVAIVRETHVSDENGTPSKTQINFSYFDGLGQPIMIKIQAEPGDAFRIDTNGDIQNDQASTRWVGNGRIVYNNKGEPVKQYEPYFSHNYDYESEDELVRYGVTPILHYDTLGRNIKTDLPDGTMTKVEFTPWQQATYDQNDTVLESQWYIDRAAPDPNGAEPNVINNASNYSKRAAWLTGQHSNTPKVEHLDTLGRVFLMVDDNGDHGLVKTRFVLDIIGNQTAVIDAKGRLITRNHFNMSKEVMQTESMDAGRRWSLSNVLGNPIYQWNDRNIRTRISYDQLQRPLGTYISENGAIEKIVYYTIYGELLNDPAAKNHFGQLYQLYDQAGRIVSASIDFKGNVAVKEQQVCIDYKNTIDWIGIVNEINISSINSIADSILEQEIFSISTSLDALNRPLISRAPDGSETRYIYNEANFVEKIETKLSDASTFTPFVKNIDYDAKGQRTKIQYGNGVTTKYEYDKDSFRLTRLISTRPGNTGANVLQDLQYHYDPVGNITDLRDDAHQTIFYQNTAVEPHSSYSYDALYRLLNAKGREHPGQNGAPGQDHKDFEPRSPIPHANDGQAMRKYSRSYSYDELGNIQEIKHHSGGAGWTRTYEYNNPSQLDPTQVNNHLSKTAITGNGGIIHVYPHDIHGNMTALSHLPEMLWDFSDQLKEVQLDLSNSREYYTYTIGGGKDFGVRTRKVTEQNGKIKNRIYIGDFEVYRESNMANVLELERTTLHIQDDKGRIAIADNLTIENSQTVSNSSIIRYNLSNHLGSSTLELNDQAEIISYEEYYPFGSSSYRSGTSSTEVALKRYRYVGKEKDENTGLYYYGARYYLDWVCRFISVDDLKNEYPYYTPFQYAGNKPVTFIDLDGLEESDNENTNVKTNSNTEEKKQNNSSPIKSDPTKWNVQKGKANEWYPNRMDLTVFEADGHTVLRQNLSTADDWDSYKYFYRTNDNKWKSFTPHQFIGLSDELEGLAKHPLRAIYNSTTVDVTYKLEIGKGEADYARVLGFQFKKKGVKATLGFTAVEVKGFEAIKNYIVQPEISDKKGIEFFEHQIKLDLKYSKGIYGGAFEGSAGFKRGNFNLHSGVSAKYSALSLDVGGKGEINLLSGQTNLELNKFDLKIELFDFTKKGPKYNNGMNSFHSINSNISIDLRKMWDYMWNTPVVIGK